ncbi:MAG: alpha/beta fold hydrolase [Desulfuromonadales bacterium]|nr:alpha/beta fold hydrolase [Desulfuromonadales bacterium]
MTLIFDDTATGLPVLLIHGFPLSRKMWQPQVDALAKAGYRVITPDLPGFGESPPLNGSVSMAAYADAIIDLLDRLEIDRAVIGGMSMGGYVLLDLVERHPQRLMAALFLVTRAAADDAAGRVRRGDLAGAVRGGDREMVPDAFEKLLFAPGTSQKRPELVAAVRKMMDAAAPEGVVGGLLAMRDRKDYLALLPTFHLPALVIGATEDLAIPPDHAETLAAGLPDAELHIIANAGHMVNLEKPEAFNRILLNYLQGKNLI